MTLLSWEITGLEGEEPQWVGSGRVTCGRSVKQPHRGVRQEAGQRGLGLGERTGLGRECGSICRYWKHEQEEGSQGVNVEKRRC